MNLLGIREPETYGHRSFEEYFVDLKGEFSNLDLSYFQTNHEGVIIDKLQEVGFEIDGIIINPGGYTHTSIALADTVAAITTPVVEVHISDIYQREDFRHVSYIKAVAHASIVGMGLEGYRMAIKTLSEL